MYYCAKCHSFQFGFAPIFIRKIWDQRKKLLTWHYNLKACMVDTMTTLFRQNGSHVKPLQHQAHCNCSLASSAMLSPSSSRHALTTSVKPDQGSTARFTVPIWTKSQPPLNSCTATAIYIWRQFTMHSIILVTSNIRYYVRRSFNIRSKPIQSFSTFDVFRLMID